MTKEVERLTFGGGPSRGQQIGEKILRRLMHFDRDRWQPRSNLKDADLVGEGSIASLFSDGMHWLRTNEFIVERKRNDNMYMITERGIDYAVNFLGMKR